MIRLKDNQKILLKELYLNHNYSQFQLEIEKLGNLDDLPEFLKIGYAGAIVLNNQSDKKNLLKAVLILDKVYQNNNNLEALYNLIAASLKAETYFKVIKHLNKRENSDDPIILEGLAKINFIIGNIARSNFFYEKLLNLDLDKKIDGPRMTYLFSMNYLTNFSQNIYLENSKKMQIIFDKNSELSKFKNINLKNKKIKIGFLSGDFKNHSVGIFLKGLINKLDKNLFELIGLSNLSIQKQDEYSKFFKDNFNKWIDIFEISDEKLVEMVRSLNLDIFFDLAGYSSGNRINIFATRCAPKQVLWLGYNNTTGLKNMDYLIADPNLIKDNEKNLYLEKILYLPKIWNAMSIPESLPEINKFNKLNKKYFKFGSFNNFQKISEATIKVWSKILKKTNSKLILKNSVSYNEEINANLKNKFIQESVKIENIIFLKNKKTNTDHLKDYNEIDLCLDTFPYPGVTTSFEANIMGVPVLTRKGYNFNSRCGESINRNLGLDYLIAKDDDDYIDKAIYFSKSMNTDQNFRENHRKKTMSSPLYDIDNFSKQFNDLLLSLYSNS